MINKINQGLLYLLWTQLSEEKLRSKGKVKKNDYITFMASTSIVEATKSPDVEVPASLGIQVEADRSLETVVAASDGSS